MKVRRVEHPLQCVLCALCALCEDRQTDKSRAKTLKRKGVMPRVKINRNHLDNIVLVKAMRGLKARL